MIMPYGRKPTQTEAGCGPAEIDFNTLWDRGYVPVIEALGYEPVRADQDTGALIITQMLERIYFADLVLADLTIANGNGYYEVGIRHASKQEGCVLLAADWSRQLFDVAQLRTCVTRFQKVTSPSRRRRRFNPRLGTRSRNYRGAFRQCMRQLRGSRRTSMSRSRRA